MSSRNKVSHLSRETGSQLIRAVFSAEMSRFDYRLLISAVKLAFNHSELSSQLR